MNSHSPIPVVVLYGPTACGKTNTAFSLFSRDLSSICGSVHSPFAGHVEVVSADSVQVYQDLSIGSARPSPEECGELTHHLVGICPCEEEFSVADFVHHADVLCTAIHERGNIPVILGGTGFYIKHFLYGLPVTPQADQQVRNTLQRRMEKEGSAAMLTQLYNIDPITAAKLHVHDEYRILRAYEVYEISGKPLSSFRLPDVFRSQYRFCPFFLNRPRDELYSRIEMRVDAMFRAGLQDEVRNLVRKGCTANSPAMKAIGYREFFEVNPADPGQADSAVVSELIKRNTKRYAKRQQTFFQSLKSGHNQIHCIDLSCTNALSGIIRILEAWFAGENI